MPVDWHNKQMKADKVIAKRLAAIWRQMKTVYYDMNLEQVDIGKLELMLKDIEKLKDKYSGRNKANG